MDLSAPLFGLEIHDASLWEPSRVLPVIDTMERWGYNALVLHQNDLLDECTQLDLSANYGVSDLRLKKVRNKAAWLNRLVDRLAEFDARLFLEIKEPSFEDYALELYPALLGADGQPDPTREEWVAFCRAKVDDLLTRVPGLGGLIVNLSSPESRVSMPDYDAVQGSGFDKRVWFERMIEAFHGALAATGKCLYIRDFSYTAVMQSDVLAAVDSFGGAVGASIKITAHDYFPEFPENPALDMSDAPTLLEFEGFGEHTGWGVIPNCRVAEFKRRMDSARARRASGFLMRISWEAVRGAHALDSLSAVNVFALPRLFAQDCDPLDLVLAWLGEAHGVEGALADATADLLLESWEIPAAAYWNGSVFPRHSCLPSSWQEGWLSMETSGMGRRDWVVTTDPADPRLSEEARVALFAEKSAAVKLADQLAEKAKELASDLPPSLADQFSAFDWLPIFARQFELATQATFYAARGQDSDLKKLPDLVARLKDLADEIDGLFKSQTDLLHHAKVLFDPDQIRLFAASLPKA